MSQRSYVHDSPFPPLKPGVLRLYNMRFCPYAHRTRLVLEHKKIPYEVVNIHLRSKPDWFLAINPLGLVPVLQIDDKVVMESTATCDWLDDVYPENRLQPEDPYRRAWDRILFEYLGKLTGASRGVAWGKPEDVPGMIAELEKHLKFYEDKLAARGDGPFFGGPKPAMIDLLVWPWFERLPMLALLKHKPDFSLDPAKYPKLTAYSKAMWELPAVKAIGFEPNRHATWYQGYIEGSPDYDIFLEE
ncbi:glutathione s-transferase omega [Plakobranchus ocellatus]|uniref:Glutathione S-transferase omega n=1 Tax=Plakobranchus ocellatus TaxID=259542 RepID=A0AAV3XYL7_9GAST|nr:glutathione s-transferase omega [Plakobranchus ocellatus]